MISAGKLPLTSTLMISLNKTTVSSSRWYGNLSHNRVKPDKAPKRVESVEICGVPTIRLLNFLQRLSPRTKRSQKAHFAAQCGDDVVGTRKINIVTFAQRTLFQ